MTLLRWNKMPIVMKHSLKWAHRCIRNLKKHNYCQLNINSMRTGAKGRTFRYWDVKFLKWRILKINSWIAWNHVWNFGSKILYFLYFYLYISMHIRFSNLTLSHFRILDIMRKERKIKMYWKIYVKIFLVNINF